MAVALGVDPRALGSDPETMQGLSMPPDAEAGPQKRGEGPEALDPFVRDLYTGAVAALALVVADGEARFMANDMFAAEFLAAHELHAALPAEQAEPLDLLDRCVVTFLCPLWLCLMSRRGFYDLMCLR
jgi:hypothetical protein